MDIELCPRDPGDKPTLRNLFQFYCHDSSGWVGDDVAADGLFELDDAYFGRYWTEAGWSGHLIRVDGQVAGFVLLELLEVAGASVPELADLFVLRRYRRRGVGAGIVRRLLARRSEPWAVTVFDADVEARAFWAAMFPALAPGGLAPPHPDPFGREARVYLLPPTAGDAVPPHTA